MALCWSCKTAEYHDYKDRIGPRCPSCGQKQKDDPAKVVKTEAPKAPVKRARSTR